MGKGFFDSDSRLIRTSALGYDTKSAQEIFTSRSINSSMNPYGIKVRESRDSVDHPNSLAIVLGLDVTGSMGSVPHYLIKEGLPHIMNKIMKKIQDPQILFMGIGDHECDEAPLQVGQFESSDELLDKWLTDLYLEGHGGGNEGESYMLAHYFSVYHTSIDCFEKRGHKGFLFTIGDEPVLKRVPENFLKKLMGPGQYQDFSASELIDRAREKYEVFHIHIEETASGSRQFVIDGWKQLLSDHLLIAKRREQVFDIIADTVCGNTVQIQPTLKPEHKEDIIL